MVGYIGGGFTVGNCGRMGNNAKIVDSLSNRRPQSKPNSNQDWGKLTLKYLHNLPQQLDEISAVLEVKDYPAIKKHAHRIKGTSGTYGLETISQAAAKLERSANSGDPDAIVTIINKIKRLVELAASQLDSLKATSVNSLERIANE